MLHLIWSHLILTSKLWWNSWVSQTWKNKFRNLQSFPNTFIHKNSFIRRFNPQWHMSDEFSLWWFKNADEMNFKADMGTQMCIHKGIKLEYLTNQYKVELIVANINILCKNKCERKVTLSCVFVAVDLSLKNIKCP